MVDLEIYTKNYLTDYNRYSGNPAVRDPLSASGIRHQEPVVSLIFPKKLKTYQIAKEFYRESKKLWLKEPLKNQFQRATLSVLLNLAEGSAKTTAGSLFQLENIKVYPVSQLNQPTAKDRKRFYAISLDSLRETQAILDLIDHKELIEEADVLGGFLYQLWKNT